ncbi:MAG: phospho-sugar mutase, partial [Clostridia bacterium]|nr:phospho-sugar mutase [Clostridia bacterium]
GVGLLERLNQLYAEYGYCLNTLHSYQFEGAAGFRRMQQAMAALRGGVAEAGGRKVEELLDYAPGLDGLPKADVLKLLLEGGASLVVRPSGTESKLKLYASVSAKDEKTALAEEERLVRDIEMILGINE